MVFLATSFYYKTALVAYCFAMKPHWWPDFLLLSKWPQWPVFASEKSMTCHIQSDRVQDADGYNNNSSIDSVI